MINISQDEFAGFVHENQHKFYRLAYSYVKNRDEALDLVQEAVVRALQKAFCAASARVYENVVLPHPG